MTTPFVSLDCATPGCSATTLADMRHLANLTASGGWTCDKCDRAERRRSGEVTS